MTKVEIIWVSRNVMIPLTVLLVLIVGCRPSTEEVARQLDSKVARNAEAMKAIEHYTSTGEHRKLEVLIFILKNADGHFALTNILSDKYDSILAPAEFGGELPADDRKYGLALDRLVVMEQRYGQIKPALTKIRDDIDLLESNFLIENIDYAFEAWRKAPWAKDLSLADFCKHVLPYRVDHEPVNRWRESAFENFEWVMEIDTIDRMKACSIVNDSLKNVLSNMMEMKMYPIRLTYDNMNKIKVGVCEDLTAFATMSMRSVGLPVGIDFVPQWPWRSMGHSWNYLLLEDGRTVPFMGTESNPGVPHFELDKKGKVYRKTFAKQANSLSQIESDHSMIPQFFRSPYFKDVTDLYVKAHDVTIPLSSASSKANRYVYLSVFDNKDWIPIDWAEIKNGKADFTSVEGGIVYLPTYYQDHRNVSSEQPIFIDENGEINQIVPDLNETQTLSLKRKYPLRKEMSAYLEKMRGGRFELANKPDFSDAVTFGVLEDRPEPYLRTMKNSVSDSKYRYVRYVASDSGRCNMAILNFYGSGGDKIVKLDGKIIGTDGSYKGYGATKEKAFDNDPSTFFDANEADWGKAWIGLALDRPVRISHVDFMPRNDTNTIFAGQVYELFYWDKGWRGTGKKTGDSSAQIVFNDVPSGALYLLHNHSGGNEERIFTYSKGEVIWF